MEHGYIKRFEDMGAVIRDSHFVLASGKHSKDYFDADVLFKFAEENLNFSKEIGEAICERFSGAKIDVVIGPATGGNVLAVWVANTLNSVVMVETKAVESNGENNFIVEDRNRELLHRGKVLIVEDVVTTGVSVEKVVVLTRKLGGDVVGIGAICTHGITSSRKMGVPKFQSLTHMQIDTYDYAGGHCPLCNRGVPVNVQHGHGQEFLNRLAAS